MWLRMLQGICMFKIKTVILLCSIPVMSVVSHAADGQDAKRVDRFQKQVGAVLAQFCSKCHGPDKQEAGLKIGGLDPDLLNGGDGEHWEEVLNQLNVGAMPPEDEPQPSSEQRDQLTSSITAELKYAAEIIRSTGGRNVLRRLTRYEYNNTLRDLLGIYLDFAKDLPPEGAAEEGFKNNSSVLITSSLHLEYFQRIAKSGLEKALVPGSRPQPVEIRLKPASVLKPAPANVKKRKGGQNSKGASVVEAGVVLQQSGYVQFRFSDLPLAGPIRIRVQAGAMPVDGWVPRLHIELGNDAGNSARPTKTVASLDIDAPRESPRWYEFHIRAEDFPLQTISSTRKQFLSISNPFDPGTSNLKQDSLPQLFIGNVEIDGPFYEMWPPETRTRILMPSTSENNEGRYSREVIEKFMLRAYRRPPSVDELQRMHDLFRTLRSRKAPFEDAMIDTLSAVLSAPCFLLIAEPASAEVREPKARRLNDYEIASRLSYFLWSTMPDDVLFELAASGKLRDPRVLASQVGRMLSDPRSGQFVEHFASQWLDLDSVYRVAVNPEFFPEFREDLKDVMRQETVQFFGTVLQEDLSSLKLIDSDFAMLNAELGRHYGIKGLAGSELRKVSLSPDQRRGGILTHGSILTGNSSGDDTHPVKRGVWLLERLLGDPPPPPPPAVPTLAEADTKGQRLSLKQKLIAHREEAACMNCHRKIDPWGLAFENYDGVGVWRDSTFAVAAVSSPAKIRTDHSQASDVRPPEQATADITASTTPVDEDAWPTMALKAASVAIGDDDSVKVRELKAAINASQESLQRPYNHLRRVGPKGPASQHRRFLGYIELRTPVFNAALKALLVKTGEDKAAFMKSFVADNRQVLESNRLVLELAAKASPPSADKRPPGKLSRRKQPRRSKKPAADVDPRTTLSDDTPITSLDDLKVYLLEYRRDQFAETLVSKTLSYSLGRYLDFTDTQTVRELTAEFQRDGYKLRGLITNVALSELFLTK